MGLTKLRFHLPKNKLTKGFRMLTHEKNLAQINTLTTANTDAINTTPTTDLNTATSPISATQLILDPLQDSISSLELVRVSDSDADVVNAARVSFGKQIMSLTERDEKLIALQL
jgi:hypothetical protein